MAKVNLGQLTKTLAKVDYPINKQNLIRYAEYKGLDERFLRSFKQLPSKQYLTLDRVIQAILRLAKRTVTQVNPVQLDKFLAQINYPISKRDLLKTAEYKGVDERILRRVKQLPRQIYQTPEQIRHAVFEIENN
ncbi:conserved hypothetical protein [Gloeothece citriformis PCC 7424]|uniref:DUF2795 domain-containing protein n=1 Tax=Gloeothece citriformis (strain PCC 7424) TaxID=65393 RepID=B7KHR4_GLOC7|nr:DUF2795 domain-containing protein [Gloeothece citriformis]ACK72011.1 conserved hypothetical protein [Gloeothece citriformis PCC 7424]